MDIFTMGAIPTAQPAASMAGTQPAGSGDGGTDFSVLLASMGYGSATGTSSAAAGQPRLFTGAGQADTQAAAQALTWQDLNGMLGTAASPDTGLQSGELDPELAAMLQMLQGTLQSHTMGGAGNTQQVLDLIGQIQKKLLEVSENNGQYMAGQQLLALLGQMGVNDPFAQEGTNLQSAMGDGTALLNSVLNGDAVDAMELMLLNSSPEVAHAMANAQNLGAEDARAQVFTNTLAAAQADLVEVSHETGAAAETPLAFEGAVRAAQLNGTQAAQGGETETAIPEQADDIDALQKQVDAGAFLQNTAAASGTSQAAEAPEDIPAPAAPLDTQLEQGVAQALSKGQDRLTLTLRPAELGEVTIQITRGETGTLLNIVAQNAETQKLLNNDLATLQTALRPLNVEVGAILSQQQADLMAQQQSFEQQRQAWQQQQAAQPARGTTAAAPPAEEAVQVQAAATPAAALDTYI